MSSVARILSEVDKRVVEEHGALVKRIGHHLMSRLPSSIQLEDLVQAGMIGLLEAARNYDESRGASFTTYAGIRIRGAMLDEIRKGDWAPRSVHRNSRKVAQAVRSVENSKGRDARDSEVAKALGVSLAEYHAMIQDSNGAKIFAFDELGINVEVVASAAIEQPGPLDGLQRDDFKTILIREISKLPEREKLVLSLYYDEDKNLREVGEILGVSESRISQIHSAAMTRLQGKLAGWKAG
ncbi:MAG: RNA polymerase sigma factor FliA [Gammaproteobacteria bacterium]